MSNVKEGDIPLSEEERDSEEERREWKREEKRKRKEVKRKEKREERKRLRLAKRIASSSDEGVESSPTIPSSSDEVTVPVNPGVESAASTSASTSQSKASSKEDPDILEIFGEDEAVDSAFGDVEILSFMKEAGFPLATPKVETPAEPEVVVVQPEAAEVS